LNLIQIDAPKGLASNHHLVSFRRFPPLVARLKVQLSIMKVQLFNSSALLLLLSHLGAVSAASPIMCAPSLVAQQRLGALASNC
jgi:hypothetical protein